MLMLPCAVSRMAPEMVIPLDSVCSAPKQRNGLLSLADMVSPMTKLVPIPVM